MVTGSSHQYEQSFCVTGFEKRINLMFTLLDAVKVIILYKFWDYMSSLMLMIVVSNGSCD